MKLTKYLLLACSALFVTACSNDEDWNSASDVTVQMAESSMSVFENVDLFYVPVEVVGKANGPVRVTIDVTETSSSPAVSDKNYIITSKTVVIPAGKTEVNIEIAATNDFDFNDDRQFTISIASAEGAKIGAQAVTDITIADDEHVPYQSVIGKWTLSDLNYFDDQPESYSVTIKGVSESSPNYNRKLYLSGFGEYLSTVFNGVSSPSEVEVEFEYDEDTDEITLGLVLGQKIGVYNNGTDHDVYLFGIEGGYIVDEGVITAEVSANRRAITFEPYGVICFYIDGLGVMDASYGIELTR